GGIHGRANQAVRRHRQDYRVRASVFSLLPYTARHVVFRRVNGVLESKAFSYSKPLGIQIGSDNGCTRPAGEHGEDNTDGPLANHEHGFARFEAQRRDPFQAGVYRLHEASLFKRNTLRDFYRAQLDNPIHHPDVFRETSARGFKTGGASDFLISRALGEGLVTAVETPAAGDVMKDDHAVAGLILSYSRAH